MPAGLTEMPLRTFVARLEQFEIDPTRIAWDRSPARSPTAVGGNAP
jgi:hypothetical protein